MAACLVACFAHEVKYQIVLQQIASTETVVEINTCSWAVEEHVACYFVLTSNGPKESRSLYIIISCTRLLMTQLFRGCSPLLPLSKYYCSRSHSSYYAVSKPDELVVRHRCVPNVVAGKESITAWCIEKVVSNRYPLCPFNLHGASSVNCPLGTSYVSKNVVLV